jgi:hypothetical protein
MAVDGVRIHRVLLLVFFHVLHALLDINAGVALLELAGEV